MRSLCQLWVEEGKKEINSFSKAPLTSHAILQIREVISLSRKDFKKWIGLGQTSTLSAFLNQIWWVEGGEIIILKWHVWTHKNEKLLTELCWNCLLHFHSTVDASWAVPYFHFFHLVEGGPTSCVLAMVRIRRALSVVPYYPKWPEEHKHVHKHKWSTDHCKLRVMDSSTQWRTEGNECFTRWFEQKQSVFCIDHAFSLQ